VSTSQNGWPVATRDQQELRVVDGVVFPNGVLKGDVATVLHEVADRYHRTVEPLVPGTCWGWFVKPIEGSTTISNHASGTAVDFNADRHPMGEAASKTLSTWQIKACHAIIAYCGGVVRWGGDYTGRPDPMHWEIIGTPAQVKQLADKIRGDFTMTDADMDKLAGKIAAALLKSDTVPVTPANGVSTTWMVQTALGDMTTKLGQISRTLAEIAAAPEPPPA
jgi:hypothetical protein